MKKTVTVNISGIIFHIDEDAYLKLLNYLDEIRSYLSSTEGKDEIISDVEARIAEMLQQKISDTKQVITIADVEDVIKIMGEPSQFGSETEENNFKKSEQTSTAKRFYRDPDNKVIGGVCSGIGNYFNIDPLWIRIIFAVALVFFGSGILLYLFLWIITPEARTTVEKLEMRGETVNIHNIEKSVKEEISQLSKRLRKLKRKRNTNAADDKQDLYNDSIFERIIKIIVTLIRVTFRVVVISFGVVLIIIGIFLLVGFLGSVIRGGDVVSYTNMGFTNFSFSTFLQLFIDSPAQITMLTIGLILLVGIPLLMIIYNGIKMIFGFRSRFKIIGISAFSLWLTGLVLCFFLFIKVVNNFSTAIVIPQKFSFAEPLNKQLYIDIKTNDSIESFMEYNNEFFYSHWYMIKSKDNLTAKGIPLITLSTSESDSIKLLLFFEAKGHNNYEATLNAKNIKYNFTRTDTSIILDPFFTVDNYIKWRMQRLRIVIKLPEGEKVTISKRLYYFMSRNNDNIDYNMFGKKLIMFNGDLKEYEHKKPDELLKETKQ
jgi:phage shock protein PspC (stress-responsive transcriptional regulator)